MGKKGSRWRSIVEPRDKKAMLYSKRHRVTEGQPHCASGERGSGSTRQQVGSGSENRLKRRTLGRSTSRHDLVLASFGRGTAVVR